MPPATCSGGDDAPRRCAEKTTAFSSPYNGFSFGLTLQRVENYIKFVLNDRIHTSGDHILTAGRLLSATFYIIEREQQICM